MAPAATAFSVAVTYVDDGGVERYGFAVVPVAAEGVEVHGDWDGLGMRASGSDSVSFHGVRVPAGAVRDGFPVDRTRPELLDRFLASGVFHAAASLGIAEAAHEVAGDTLRKRDRDPFTDLRLAESVVDLAAMRATFDRAAHLVDEVEVRDPTGEASVEEWSGWFAEAQAAKVAVTDGAQRVVDRALTVSGGAGYVASHPLARAYRDVRAGGFMHPLGANRAYRFLADVELGEIPCLR
jgi:alkylation response protein AidB-like acyl-CoA dehydrogenase